MKERERERETMCGDDYYNEKRKVMHRDRCR